MKVQRNVKIQDTFASSLCSRGVGGPKLHACGWIHKGFNVRGIVKSAHAMTAKLDSKVHPLQDQAGIVMNTAPDDR